MIKSALRAQSNCQIRGIQCHCHHLLLLTAPSLKLHPFSYETLGFSKLPSKPNILVNRYPPTSVVPLHFGAPLLVPKWNQFLTILGKILWGSDLCGGLLRARPDWDFPWGLGIWKRNLVSCLKPGTRLAKPVMTWARALGELRFWILGSQFSPLHEGLGQRHSCDILCSPCVPLNSFLLTLSHCIASCRFSPLQTVCKKLCFISLPGIRHSLCKTSWPQPPNVFPFHLLPRSQEEPSLKNDSRSVATSGGGAVRLADSGTGLPTLQCDPRQVT